MYALIYIAVTAPGVVSADYVGEYPTMTECFEARENILVEHRAFDGFLEAGTQAVCIQLPE